MSRHRWTPGPWCHVSLKDGWHIETPGGVEIARVSPQERVETTNMNAAVLSRAPELLETLREVARMAASLRGPVSLDYAPDLVAEIERAARATLAKLLVGPEPATEPEA